MPMQTRTLVPKHIVHVYDNPVSQVDFDGGAGPLVVDANDVAFEAVGGGAYPGYVPVVDYGFGDGQVEVGKAQEEEGEEERGEGSEERGR